ncbi:ATP-binding protein [Streptomyces sp. DG2A-72]|uniref:sensor histidine kinase n=1 Tax=Streptomyces sp. DG2A-72 TaxID=3051386 RepID=UPI00265BD8A3|nr:ATP-binding protein [Streptomyces sp. DG2A-72]MDO0934840.1 ATP-binding protein [Streptomyces sp. DG2A-72]
MRLAVLPAALMAVLSAALVAFVLLTQDGTADGTTWTALIAGAVLGCGVLAGAVRAGRAAARDVSRQHAPLRRAVAEGQAALRGTLQRLERGEPLEQQAPFAQAGPPPTDPVDRLAYEIRVGTWQACTALAQSAQLPRGSAPDSEERVEVFVNLARRLQSLVHRAINMLDQLENEVEDPELLKGLFHVDHLATRIRRHAENVAVLGGSVSRRQWTRPVTLTEVLRSSIAEVEHYSRVKLVPPIEGTVRGHAVADVIHLLAELVENATMFSEPHAQVLLRAQRVTAGLAIEVEDRGLGMPLEEQARINALLAEPDHIDLGKLLADGRIGLYVVSALARRHGIAVRLQSNIYGGIQAILIIPPGLLGDEPGDAPAQAAGERQRPPQAAPAPAQRPVPPHQQQITGAQQQAGRTPAARPVMPPPAFRQPLPPAQAQAAAPAAPGPMAQQPARGTGAPPPYTPPQQHARGTGAPQAYDRGPSLGSDARDGRPPLPQRQAQEHLVPELRNGPAPRRSDDQEVEHDPGLMAMFRRGVDLADNEPDEPHAGGSR